MASKAAAKGSGFERELAKHLTDTLGIDVQRTPLSGGGMTVKYGPQMPDLMGTPEIWVEAKRTETFRPREAMAQALRGIGTRPGCEDMPIVVNRQNRQTTGDSLTVIRLDDFLRIYAGYLRFLGILK